MAHRLSLVAWRALKPHAATAARLLGAALIAMAGGLILLPESAVLRATWVVLCGAVALYGAHVLFALAGILFGLPPELRRKLQHLLAGGAITAIGWSIGLSLAVTMMCSAMVAWLVFSKRLKDAQTLRHLTMSRRDSRQTHGEMLLPLGLLLSLWVAGGTTPAWFFGALTLTLADAAAALVGVHMGRMQYGVHRGAGQKSVEGNLAFFAVTLILGWIILPDAGLEAPATAVLALMSGAVVLTVLESLCTHGLDNLLLPMAAVLLVQLPGLLSSQALLGVAIASLALLVWIAKRSSRLTL